VIVSRGSQKGLRAVAAVCALGALALLGSGAGHAADRRDAVAQVSHSAGAMVWRPGSDRVTLSDREWLSGSQFIETTSGGYVQIQFRDGTELRAGSSSSLLLGYHRDDQSEIETVTLNLNRGTYRLITGHTGALLDIHVTTPTTIIRPIGTDYEIRVGSAGATEVSVREGAVVALATSGRGSRTVEAGNAVTLAGDRNFRVSLARFSRDPGLNPRTLAALPLTPSTNASARPVQSVPGPDGTTGVANAPLDAERKGAEDSALDLAAAQLETTVARETVIGARLRTQGIRTLNSVADETRAATAYARAASDRAVSSVSRAQRLAEADLRAARRLLSTTDLR
jgi:hypothetical protein